MSELLLTAAQMRALEIAAIESGAVTGLDLMERAGRGAVAAIEAEWPDLAATPGRAAVLCGPGNNGGDGFVVARLLAETGWTVEVFLYGDADKLPPDARVNCERWREMGEVRPLLTDAVHWNSETILLVDALFGTGLSRPISELRDLFSQINDAADTGRGLTRSDRILFRAPWIVSLDVPSGLCADSGRFLETESDWSADSSTYGGGLYVDLTCALHTRKPGHFLESGSYACGKLAVIEIGLSWLERPETTELIEGVRPFCLAKTRLHKYDHGHALVLTGGFGRTGAARLAARAALRIGAGLVTVAAPGSAMMECAAQLTAIMLRRCDDADALKALLEDDRLNALCLGPGLGTDDRAAALVATALASGRACTLDADALTLVAGDDALRGALHDRCVLTPHAGEFARLFPVLSARLNAPARRAPPSPNSTPPAKPRRRRAARCF